MPESRFYGRNKPGICKASHGDQRDRSGVIKRVKQETRSEVDPEAAPLVEDLTDH